MFREQLYKMAKTGTSRHIKNAIDKYEKDRAIMPGQEDGECCSIAFIEQEIQRVMQWLLYNERMDAETAKPVKTPNVKGGDGKGQE